MVLVHFFYKDAWNIVNNDVIYAVLDVLQSRIVKELITIIITLIPKTKCPINVIGYRPISYCNTLYKCVTKVLSESESIRSDRLTISYGQTSATQY